MSDVKQCDRCGDVVSVEEWRHNRRVTAIFKQTTKAATRYSPEEYELCSTCAHMFVEWVLDGQ